MQCTLVKGTLAHSIYGEEVILERHRHRYEINSEFFPLLANHRMVTSGFYDKKNLVEIVELLDHPWFLAVQFHPEWRSKPDRPHPLFTSFVAAMVKFRKR